ncbi:DUF6527 family protein [Chenggangzhangella methanolivorans]|uniref:Uncharacterized protein n=1 Tax=Chenggangzhangella methanolivorans TaxID=1437009 RepID=A0A9E6RDJ0_9HYPH|nr:DUF6527 family protein [Chenggangzhangella methanolivorans]QZN99105.1 hypothetical protein K6K41_19980 [Chenggangzhangella methanolivorans]
MSIRWWDWLPFQPWRQVDVVEAADEVPETMPARGVVLVGRADAPKWAVFDCPCGRQHRIMLNLDDSRKPFWRVAVAERWHYTIVPSVDAQTRGRRCHYHVRNGRTAWAADSDR